jgi:D-amino peptidase
MAKFAPVKVFVSVDMEGITGITESAEMTVGGRDHERARALMARDANAAVAGAFDGGATEVVVCDAHSLAANLVPEAIDARAQVVRGRPKPGRMVEGLDASFGALLCVGFHERAGGGDGVLNHTWAGAELLELRLDGEPAGELRLLASVAGQFGVPLALVTGDDRWCAEARALAPHVRTAQVKTAIDRFAARLEHPDVTGPRIREAAAAAVRAAPAMPPTALESPVRLEIEWASTSIAAQCELVPGIERTGPRSVGVTAGDALAAYPALIVCGIVAASAVDANGY